MKLNIIFILNTIVAGVYGLAFVLAPAQVNALYGTAATDAPLAFMCQLFGAALIGYAVLTWLARNATASDSRDAIVLANKSLASEGASFLIEGLLNDFGDRLKASYAITASRITPPITISTFIALPSYENIVSLKYSQNKWGQIRMVLKKARHSRLRQSLIHKLARKSTTTLSNNKWNHHPPFYWRMRVSLKGA